MDPDQDRTKLRIRYNADPTGSGSALLNKRLLEVYWVFFINTFNGKNDVHNHRLLGWCYFLHTKTQKYANN